MMAEQCPLCASTETSLLSISDRRGMNAREYHECALCRLIFVPERFHLSREEEKSRYDLHENNPKDERYVRFLSKLTGPLADHLKGGQQGLDFGCGSGPAIAALLEKNGHQVLNYDPFYFSDRALLSNTYDFISCSEVIEHFRAPREEFLRLHELLRPDGTLGIMTELYSGNKEKSIDQWWYTSEPTHICFYAPATFEWIARWLQWKIIFREGNAILFRKG